MPLAIFADAVLATIKPSAWHKPSRCPYCPAGALSHWIGWGRYQRYAGDPLDPSRRIDVARYRCALVGRTFSLLPDSLLPYCGIRTGELLGRLHALFVQAIAAATLARHAGLARSTLRGLKTRFLRTLPKLRLPRHEGALKAPAFLTALADTGAVAVADLFRGWKEREPKLSIVGVYVR